MKTTTSSKLRIIIPVVVYLIIWEALALYIDSRVLLVSPVKVVVRLFELMKSTPFWQSICFSLLRIFLGLVLAIGLSLISGISSAKSRIVKDMLEPLIMTMKATPVASIVILVLIWVSSRNLSLVISFMMVFPVMHTSLYEGIINVYPRLLEMADVYGVGTMKRIRYIYLPQIASYFESGITISLGLCFKSGIAAEVIAIPDGSIGEKLYEAKLYLATADLFAWTVAIIILAKVFEKVLLFIVRKALTRMEVS